MPVPNLDILSVERLFDFSEKHKHGREYKLLFPTVTRDTIPDTATLACFAHCKFCERVLTKMGAGHMPQAMTWQAVAESFYARLSPTAQWRKRK